MLILCWSETEDLAAAGGEDGAEGGGGGGAGGGDEDEAHVWAVAGVGLEGGADAGVYFYGGAADAAEGVGAFEAGAVGDERPIEVAGLGGEGAGEVADAGAEVGAGILHGWDEGGVGGGAAELLGEGGGEQLEEADFVGAAGVEGAWVAGALAQDEGEQEVVVEGAGGAGQAAFGGGFGERLADERAPLLDGAAEGDARRAAGGRDRDAGRLTGLAWERALLAGWTGGRRLAEQRAEQVAQRIEHGVSGPGGAPAGPLGTLLAVVGTGAEV